MLGTWDKRVWLLLATRHSHCCPEHTVSKCTSQRCWRNPAANRLSLVASWEAPGKGGKLSAMLRPRSSHGEETASRKLVLCFPNSAIYRPALSLPMNFSFASVAAWKKKKKKALAAKPCLPWHGANGLFGGVLSFLSSYQWNREESRGDFHVGN